MSTDRWPTPEELARQLGGSPRKEGHGWLARCPAHDDRGPSLSIWIDQHGCLAWNCFGGCEHRAVRQALLDEGLIPDGSTRIFRHKGLGVPVASWEYLDAAGKLVALVDRYEPTGGTKQYRPRVPHGDWWRCKDPEGLWPLYRLPQLARAPADAPVLLVEGEKAADAAARLLPGWVVTTSAHGAKSAKKTDWAPLAGRQVTIWPDNDEGGQAYVKKVVPILQAQDAAVRVVQPPADWKNGKGKGWDLADPLPDGFTVDDLHKFLEQAAVPKTQAKTHNAHYGKCDEANNPAFTMGLSHDALALGLGEAWHLEARYVSAWGQWLFWDGARWAPDKKLRHLTLTRQYLRQRAVQLLDNAQDDAERIAAAKAGKLLRSAGTVAAVEAMARSNPELVAGEEDWDLDPYLLNTPAGTVMLRTGELRPARPDDRITKVTAVAPAPPGTPAPRFMAFLRRILAHDLELIPFLQRWLGYGLTGDISEHKFVFASGTGGNGKTTLFEETIAPLMADYATTAPQDMFLMSPNADKHPTDMAALQNSRFVIASELQEGRPWDLAKLKKLTGGGQVQARKMRQDFFLYRPGFKLCVFGNDKPSFKSVDDAIRRRLLLVPFKQKITDDERNPHLAQELREEWPAILRWMIDGCLAWQADGLQPPKSVLDASEEYIADEDSMTLWKTDYTVEAPYRETWYSPHQLWESYQRCCREYQLTDSVSFKTFTNRLTDYGWQPYRPTGQRGYSGRKLIEPDRGDNPRAPAQGEMTYRANGHAAAPAEHRDIPF